MRLKTLNGAPLRATLDFSPEAFLPPDVAAQFFYQNSQSREAAEDAPLKWRHVTSKDQRLRSDWSQPYLPTGDFHGSDPDVTFALPGIGASLDAERQGINHDDTTMTFEENNNDESEFVYHSLIFNDTLLSSQIVEVQAADLTTTSQSFLSTSIDSTTSTNLEACERSNADQPILQVPSSLQLTTLGALPNAAQLRRIYPQTPTPNLLCVLTAPPEDREVFVKKGGYKMRLREIIVADNTKSGFKVSFWQKPSDGSGHQKSLDSTIQRIATGDILLLRNVALNAFRDDVFGQSLNVSITRAKTSIEILMSGSGISSRQLAALPAPIRATFTRVKKWANSHIASNTTGNKKRKDGSQINNTTTKRVLRSSTTREEALPPDSLEPI